MCSCWFRPRIGFYKIQCTVYVTWKLIFVPYMWPHFYKDQGYSHRYSHRSLFQSNQVHMNTWSQAVDSKYTTKLSKFGTKHLKSTYSTSSMSTSALTFTLINVWVTVTTCPSHHAFTSVASFQILWVKWIIPRDYVWRKCVCRHTYMTSGSIDTGCNCFTFIGVCLTHISKVACGTITSIAIDQVL